MGDKETTKSKIDCEKFTKIITDKYNLDEMPIHYLVQEELGLNCCFVCFKTFKEWRDYAKHYQGYVRKFPVEYHDPYSLYWKSQFGIFEGDPSLNTIHEWRIEYKE